MRPAGTGQLLLEQGGTMSQRENLMKVSRPNIIEVGIFSIMTDIKVMKEKCLKRLSD